MWRMTGEDNGIDLWLPHVSKEAWQNIKQFVNWFHVKSLPFMVEFPTASPSHLSRNCIFEPIIYVVIEQYFAPVEDLKGVKLP